MFNNMERVHIIKGKKHKWVQVSKALRMLSDISASYFIKNDSIF